jgi:hydrogenase maturation protease
LEPESDILVIGIGNEFRTDDALGLFVARELVRRHPAHVIVREADGEGASLLEMWEGWKRVVLVDALSSGEPAGLVHRVDVMEEHFSKELFHASTHAFGVAEAVEMARQLGRLPVKLVLFGIEGKLFEPGVGLTDPVVKSIPELLHAVQDEIDQMRCP